MYRIDPYEFTETDAARTIANLPDIWAEMVLGRDESVIAHLRPELDGAVTDVLQRVWAAMLAAGPALRAAGQLPRRAEGVVAHLHVSDGGVPKTPVDAVEIGWRGVVGDRQASREHHGRPWQALCLWSTEVIDTFVTEGHPIAAGSAGENITVSGLDWSTVRPGVRLQLGSVLCEIGAWTLPCKKNKAWFSDGDFNRMHHERGPVSRAYATVLEPGRIVQGDPAILEP